MVILLIKGCLLMNGSELTRRAGYWCARAEERTPTCRGQNDAVSEAWRSMCLTVETDGGRYSLGQPTTKHL